MRRLPTAALAALALLSCGKPAPWGPAWTAEAAVLATLGEETEAEFYRFRLPPGFRPAPTSPGPEGVRNLVWKGAPRAADRSTASFSLLYSPLAAEEATTATLETMMSTLIEGLKRRREDFVHGAVEKGMIDGIPFLRVRWTGKEPTLNLRIGGVNYYGLHGLRVLHLTAQDSEPHLSESLRLGEAAILSLRRK